MKHRRPPIPQPRRPVVIDSKQRGKRKQADSLQQDERDKLVALFNAGRLVELENRARLFTERYSESEFGWMVLGTVLKMMGRTADALTATQQAVALLPNNEAAYSNLGAIFQDIGQPKEAEASCRRALQIKQDLPDSLNNLGGALIALDRLHEGESSCRKAIALAPDSADAYSTLGKTLLDQGRLAETEIISLRALRIRPNNPKAYLNLGIILMNKGRSDQTEARYRQAIAIRPDYPEGLTSLASILIQMGRLEEAEICCRRALAVAPNHVEACSNLGSTLTATGHLDEAMSYCRRALSIKPDLPEAFDTLGRILAQLGRLGDAEASYRFALRLKPDYAQVHSNLLLILNYHPGLSAAALFAEHREWDLTQTARCERVISPRGDRNPSRRLRVGYVSPDLRQHSVAYFFEPLLREHDRRAVEIFCYADVLRPDAMTSRLQDLTDSWLTTVGLSDDALARRIVDDRIDILVDLAGHTAHNRMRVFASKPSPVQVSWLGYPHSTGLRTMDYRLVDAVTDPIDESDTFATETLVRLKDGFLCYQPPVDAPSPAAPPCLTGDRITFGSFNNPTKLSSATLDTWALLLESVPNSHLLVKGRLFADDSCRSAFLGELQRRRVASERVTLLSRTSQASDHLSLYSQIDIALDPFPYNGATTTCEALWMGVPVISLRGDRHAGRVGASILTQLHLDELIAETTEDYVRIAPTLARNVAKLTELRRTMRERMLASPLCYAPAFARKVEAAYRDMWKRHCETTDTITLRFFDGVRIVVPDSLEQITPYVMQEQKDWFEDEIKFLRRLLQPGQKVIDIGANYGVYTLSMAHAVGSTGRVWAFEPASRTAELLAKSIAANGFSHIVLEQTALSNRCGTAELSLHGNSELNSLVHGNTSTRLSEEVPLVTLDQCLEKYGWQDIAFVKIDAEGEEPNILAGGQQFFREQSPLVQYEIKAAGALRLAPMKELAQAFAQIGYDSYRLVPSLDMLVPFDHNAIPDSYLLNLFCCKQDRAESLALQGLLAPAQAPYKVNNGSVSKALTINAEQLAAHNWGNTIATLPYGVRLMENWANSAGNGEHATVTKALALYAISQDTSVLAESRFGALETSLSIFKSLCEHRPSHLRLASLARIARDYGARALAVDSLRQLIATIRSKNRVDLADPFLSPSQQFERVSPGESIDQWLLASALDAIERLASFSSFYDGVGCLDRTEEIHALGFDSREMLRRLQLVKKRFGLV